MVRLGRFSGAALALTLGMAGSAGAVDINFSFSSDLSDPSAANAVAGTVYGTIVGLTDNATSSATHVYITNYPASALGTISDPSYLTPVDVSTWSGEYANSFTLIGGVLTDASFHSDQTGPGGFDQFWLNIPLGYAKGNTNYFDIGNNNDLSIWNNEGFAAVAFGGGVPEPAAWTLMLVGFGALGGALRARRRSQGVVA
jgi:hypothetical protein